MDQVTVTRIRRLTKSQIAFQCARKGCEVHIYDIDPGAVAKLSQKWRELGAAYRKDLKADDACDCRGPPVGFVRDRILRKLSEARRSGQ